jgi:hypothetical protein
MELEKTRIGKPERGKRKRDARIYARREKKKREKASEKGRQNNVR